MSDSMIDDLFEDAIASDLPMPGTELEFFLDQLPIDDLTTFHMKDITTTNTDDLWEYNSDNGDTCTPIKKELLSDGGSPDSSSTDMYSNLNYEEEDDTQNLLNVDIFLNKPANADNDVMVNIPQRSSMFSAAPRIPHRTRINTDNIRCSNLKGRDVTEDERRMLEEEGVTIPYNVILTKNEERALKKVRRKIKNKISAAESRKRRKDYIGGLEKRVEDHTVVNVKLQSTIDELQKRNRNLMDELRRAARSVKKMTVSSQTATCLMGLLLSFTFFFFPLFNGPFQSAGPQPTSNYIPGRSLLSISDTSSKSSFIELIVEYIAERIEDYQYQNGPEIEFINNNSVFLY